MKIAVVGSRREVTPMCRGAIKRIIDASGKNDIIVTGDATGVDAEARYFSIGVRTFVTCYAAWNMLAKSAGPVRNRVIAEIAGVCHAFPCPDSRGTWDCVNAFKALGKPVRIYDWETGEPRG